MERAFDAIVPREVLYVEDHPTNAQLMRAIFKCRPQFELVVVNDGREARRVAADLRPSLLLLDLRLPDCHGTSLLMQLRQLYGWETIPAVAVTAELDFEPTGTGFCEVWPKPLDLAFVLSRLDALTADSSTPRESSPEGASASLA
jgi:CheY-like chemotaxis protein